MMEKKLTLAPIAKKFMVHHSTEEYCLCSTDHFIYKYVYSSQKLIKLCRLPSPNGSLFSKFKDILARSRIYRHFTDNIGVGHITELPSGTIIILYGKIYRFDGRSNIAELTVDYAKQSIASPLRNGIAVHPISGNAYFGEYLNNESSSIGIYCISNDGRELHCCHRFPQGEIRHVHGIFWDKYRKRLWVTTGDKDCESNLYYTDDEFTTLKKFAGGDQSWRMVTLAITKDFLYWGMDAGRGAPIESVNCIYKLNVHTKERTIQAKIANPAYHISQSTSGHMYLGTTYEPGIERKTPEAAQLWFSETGDDWLPIKSFNFKYAQRLGCTKFGHLFLPTGVIPDHNLLITPVNTDSYEFTLTRISKLI